MNMKQATGVLKPEADTSDALKAAYRAACKLYHPDINPNGLEMMKLINTAYEFLKKHIGKWSHSDRGEGPGLDSQLSAIFDKIKHMVDVNAEICGCWLWVSGNTKVYKTQLKEAGFKWSSNKTAWYWHEAGYHKRSKRTFTMPEIRGLWGSEDLEQEPLTAFSA